MTTDLDVVLQQVERNFSQWQQSLVEIKRTDEPPAKLISLQQRFVTAANESSDALAAYLCKEFGLDSNGPLDMGMPHLEPVTSDEMLNTPLKWELHVASQLQDVDKLQARSSVWWYACHIAWLLQGVFPNPPDTTFNARVNQRILSSDPESMPSKSSRKLDDATRNLLRRLGGLPHIRRHYRVAEDPPIPRAYWRHRLAMDAAASAPASSDLTAKECHRILRQNAWGKLIENSQNQFSSLLAPRALLAVCQVLQINTKGVRKDEKMKSNCQLIARRILSSHPELMEWDSLVRAPSPISQEVA